ncbi:unnamed protein product [Cyprideis torosa]|uniref:Uncharacterized protein n=1 Tax=Cyprideis torosa TaxID=163714 RepID=A0A7R8W2J3_9CRUS|nr:unnamed protein product [Cyprideis torosa]CAG0881950.1 unnamed protein product [Cyprideis torosa]
MFIEERGPSWRPTDLWDDLYSSLAEESRLDGPSDSHLRLLETKEVAQLLYNHEHPNQSPFTQKIPRPADGAFQRVHVPTFPRMDPLKVQQIMEEHAEVTGNSPSPQVHPPPPRIVPQGPPVVRLRESTAVITNNARRLEVLRDCVNCIFENKISDVRKTFPAVIRGLKHSVARQALCEQLAQHVKGSRAVLDHVQFDYVVRLMNAALSNESSLDEGGVATSFLPLATSICRKLSTGVIQFAYTCIQDHPVWDNQSFWETAYFQDVEKEIRTLYLPASSIPNPGPQQSMTQFRGRKPVLLDEPSALDLAAEQLRQVVYYSPERLKELAQMEDAILYSQATHYAHRIIYLKVPLSASLRSKGGQTSHAHAGDRDSLVNSMTNSSVVVSDSSSDEESGFNEGNVPDVSEQVVRFLKRFLENTFERVHVDVDRESTVAMLDDFKANMYEVVDIHIETLEAVQREITRLPPAQKATILPPMLIPGEELISEKEGLRGYLVPDGRGDDGVVGPLLIPAEGALFLTNYRLVFKGIPCDPGASEYRVFRSFPLMALTREKKVPHAELPQLMDVSEGLQLRAACFQLIKIGFDANVTSEDIEAFRKTVHRLRWPMSEYDLFPLSEGLAAFAAYHAAHGKEKTKNATLRGFAKKTLLKTAQKAGLRPKPATVKKRGGVAAQLHPYNTMAAFDNGRTRSMSTAGPVQHAESLENMMEREEDLDVRAGTLPAPASRYPRGPYVASEGDISHLASEADGPPHHPTVSNDARTLERLSETNYVQDWIRLGLGMQMTTHHGLLEGTLESRLSAGGQASSSAIPTLMLGGRGSRSEPFRISQVNSAYSLSRSYPALIPVPNALSDEGIRSVPTGHLPTSGNSSASVATPEHMCRTRRANVPTELQQLLSETEKTELEEVGFSQKQMGMKTDSASKVEFIPVDFTDVRHTKLAFKKLLRACLPSALAESSSSGKKEKAEIAAEPKINFYKCIEESGWYRQIQTLMQLSGAIVDLMDLQGASVMLCLEDGWDVTAQLSSIAQVCADPYYRTFAGFRTLVEREWLALGHRFSYRSCHTAACETSLFAPIFLQFLDIVYQILIQFPLSFEFNSRYLSFLAYHSISCRFGTFLFNSELERREAESVLADYGREMQRKSRRGAPASWESDEDLPALPVRSSISSSPPTGHFHHPSGGSSRLALLPSIFDFLEAQIMTSPIFHNFLYCPDPENPVLRPYSSPSKFEIWDFYLQDSLARGPWQDLTEPEDHTVDESLQQTSARRKSYSWSHLELPSSFAHLLEMHKNAEEDLGDMPPQFWQSIWDDLKPFESALAQGMELSPVDSESRSHLRLFHKKSTLDLLIRGKMAHSSSAAGLPSSVSAASAGKDGPPHLFERHNYSKPAKCDVCGELLWSFVKNGMRCQGCGINAHDRCTAEDGLGACPKTRTPPAPAPTREGTVKGTAPPAGDSGRGQAGATIGSFESQVSHSRTASSDGGTLVTPAHTKSVSTQQLYDQFSARPREEHSSHEGYLFKRGAFLKGLHQRYFVLDSIKHQLRYYDTKEDAHCKGFIDLKEVISASAVPSPPPLPGQKAEGMAFFEPLPGQKAEGMAFFELKTIKRVYHFGSMDSASAAEWVEKIQANL